MSENLSEPGTEAGGTSQIKYMMNGGAILGGQDGTNLEIENHLGESNIFLFAAKP